MITSLSLNILKHVIDIIHVNNKHSSEHSLQELACYLNQRDTFHPSIARLLPQIYYAYKGANQLHLFNNNTLVIANKSFVKSVVSHALKRQLVTKIANELKGQDIPIILLKGMAFNDDKYAVNCPRLSSDIDILVKPQFKEQAKLVLSKFMTEYEPKIKNRFEGLYENTFVLDEANQPHVDLHYYLIHPTLFPIDTATLWSGSKIHPYYNNRFVRTLSDEHNLIHLAVHCLKDMSFINYSLIDAYLLFSSSSIDLKRAFEMAQKWNAADALYLLLSNLMKITELKVTNDGSLPYCPNLLVKKMGLQLANILETSDLENKTVNYRFKQLLTQLLFTNNKQQTLKHFWEYSMAF